MQNHLQLIKNNNVADVIESAMAKYSDKPAFSCLGQTLSFAQINEKSLGLACYLQEKTNLQAGDAIVIQLPNIIQYAIAVYAALRAGLVIVNTNPLYTTREMQHQFSDSNAKAIIILEDLLPKLNDVKSNTAIETVISTKATDLLTDEITTSTVPDHISFNQAIADGKNLTLQPWRTQQVNSRCVLQYTGGTTGVSKGAELSHKNILYNSFQTLDRFGSYCLEAQETLIAPLPLYHIYAFNLNLIAYFVTGNHNVLIPNPKDIDAFIKIMKGFKFTGFAGINTLFVGLCQHPDFAQLDFSQFKMTVSGGSALTKAADSIWKKVTGCSITEGYGLSETSPGLCVNEPGNEVLGTVGKPLIETEVQIRVNNQPVADGEEGEIVVKGPQVMSGYWNRPEETAKVMTDDGFFRTGDVGILLPDGCLKIVDRLKDMIIVSGFNVYPNEIEDVLVSHPNILEAAVIGIADDRSGEAVSCFITVNSTISKDDITAHCKENLTAYKVPKHINIVDELPKSTVGKILRKELRAK